MADLTSLLIQAVAGAIGGNATGAAAKNISLGPVGNTIAGALGGGLAGPLLGSLLGIGGAEAVAGLDFASIAQGFATGGVSGALTAGVIGFIKAKFARA
jgi:hypothetical protein